MAFLDMFDKLDDLIYAPVNTVCEWTKEPLRRAESKRQQVATQQAADIENTKLKTEAEVELERKERLAQLERDQKQWDADIEDLRSTREIERNERVLNALIEYRRSIIEDAKDIANDLSQMEISLVKEAHDLVINKTNEYKALQEKAMKQCDEQLEEIGKRFANNERVRIRREDMVIAQTDDIINAAKDFISELKEDIKRININNSKRVDSATVFADKVLGGMAPNMIESLDESKLLNKALENKREVDMC